MTIHFLQLSINVTTFKELQRSSVLLVFLSSFNATRIKEYMGTI